MKFFLITFFYYFLFNVSSYAYLDPGSASIIFQAILGAIAAVGATIGLYWKKLKNFFLKIFGKKKNN